MKRFSKKQIISVIVVLVIVVAAVAGSLLLIMQKNDPAPQEQIRSPYGNFDYSKKPYFSLSLGSGAACYQNKMYYLDSYSQLCTLDLTELNKDMTSYVRKDQYEYLGLPAHVTVCAAVDHLHTTLAVSDDCPGYVGYTQGFLLDGYESAGSYPIIYYANVILYEDDIDADPWNLSTPYTIYRYDTGSNTREALFQCNELPAQMMSYGEYLYVVMRSGITNSRIIVYNKNTKKIAAQNFGAGELELVHADKEYVYVSNWQEGMLYRADHMLKNSELIFTQPEVITVSDADNTLGIFIHDGYIYYRADYEKAKIYISDDNIQFISPFQYNIRRVPLNNPNGEGELVAKGVFELCDFGVAGNKFYFTPMDYAGREEEYYYNFSNGRLCAVDLDTLECTDVVSNSNLLFDKDGDGKLLTDRYIVTRLRAVGDTGYDIKREDAHGYWTLYDFETGSIYHLYSS